MNNLYKKYLFMIRSIIPFLLIFVATASNFVYANGGPVNWTSFTPMGYIGLKNATDIHLSTEDLNIKLNDDLNSYDIKAIYHLDNRGADQTVLFGIPITFPKSEYSEERINDAQLSKNMKNATKTISLLFNNKELKCDLVSNDKAINHNFKKIENDGYSYSINDWCIAEINFEANTNNVLIMSYTAQLYFLDLIFTKSALTEFSSRKLHYILYPAGYWADRVDKLNITLNLGYYSGFEIIPEYYNNHGNKQINGNHIKWEFVNVDLKHIPSFDVELSNVLSEKKELIEWNTRASSYQRVPYKIIASSSLPPSNDINYEPANILDGDGKTAWCEGVDGYGRGEWIQFKVDRDKLLLNDFCRIEGLIITPGYIKNQKIYSINSKVKKIILSDCNNEHKQSYHLSIKDNFRISPRLIENLPVSGSQHDYILDFIKDSMCFKVEIGDVEESRTKDTCISEIALVINCG